MSGAGGLYLRALCGRFWLLCWRPVLPAATVVFLIVHAVFPYAWFEFGKKGWKMMQDRSIRLSIVIALLFAGLVVAILAQAFVYWHTREKWHELGRGAGITDAKQQVIRDLCKYRSPGLPPRRADLWIEAKASTLYLVSDARELTIYCAGIE